MKWRDIIRFQWHALWNGRFPPALIILFLPLLYAFLFGTIYSHNVVNDVPVLILDEDQSKASRTLIQMYDDSEKLRIVGYASSKEELEAAMYDGQALAAIAIPRDFSKDMKTGAGTDVAYIVNSANNMNGNAVIGAIRKINQSYSTAVAASTLEGAGVLPAWAMNLAYPIRMGLRILNNPTNGYTSFMLSALTINGLQISIMLAFTPGIVVFIRKRKLLNAARVGHREVFQRLLGAVLPYEAIALCSFCLSLGVCIVVFGLPMRGSLWDCLFLMTCFLFFLMCVLTFFGSGAASVVEAMQDPMIYIMPGVLFSGLSWPTFCMNDIGGAISLLLPMTWVGDCLRDILLAGYAPQLYKDSLVLVSAGLVIGAVGVFRIVRRIRKEGAAL